MARRNCPYILLTFATVFAVPGAMAANTTHTINPAVANYARPLSFEPNQGQTDKQVDFLAHGAGCGLFLSHAEAVIVLPHGDAKPGSRIAGTIVRLRPLGANTSTPPNALERQSSESSYYIGNVPARWHTRIPNYAKVQYRNVYPGVDLIYYGNQRQLEYDFVVNPGADLGSIVLEFQGPTQAELDREGGVLMHTVAGDVRWHKPVAYQQVNGSRKLIDCAYVRTGGDRLRFSVGAYDPSRPLIIDPVLIYSTYLGGSGFDSALGIAVDVHGAAYVVGTTGSPDFPTRSAFQKLIGPASVAFVTKFDHQGELIYSTYLGGSGKPGGDQGRAIALDTKGNAYVTGQTRSSDFPTKNAFQKNLRSTNGNAFVTKLDCDGDSLIYSTYLGGSGPTNEDNGSGEFGFGIAVDKKGEAYVTGRTSSPDFPIKNAFQEELRSSQNAFVTKLDADGDSLVYSTYLGGSNGFQSPFFEAIGDSASGIAVDRSGHAYITGQTASTDFPTRNAFQPQLKGFQNAFITKFGVDGASLVYSTYLGGSCNGFVCDAAYGIAVDAHDNAYVTGSTGSPDFPTKNAFQDQFKSCSLVCTTAFVTKLDVNGDALVYSTYLGGSGSIATIDEPPYGDNGTAVVVDRDGNAYVTGDTASHDFPTKNAFQEQLKGFSNAFITEINPDGDELVYSSYLGGSLTNPAFFVSEFVGDVGFGIAVDSCGNAYVAGVARSTDFPTKDAFQSQSGGDDDAFVTKISAH